MSLVKKMWDFKIEIIFEMLLHFIISVFICSPLIGTVVCFVGIKWSWAIWLLTILVSLGVTICFQNYKIFELNDKSKIISYICIILFTIFVYSKYAPIIEVRQDPAIYTMKAYNIINYGTLYKPMELYKQLCDDSILKAEADYGVLFNGNQYSDGKLVTDFYPGGAFFFAVIGKMCKNWMFYGTTLIMLLNALLMFEIICKITYRKDCKENIIYIIAFFVSPIIVWFGRGTYCEPSALLYTLLLLICIIKHNEVNPIALCIITITSYTTRIDYVFVMMISIFLMMYISKKWAVITAALSVIQIYICSHVYYTYYNRIVSNDLKLLKYSIILIILTVLISTLVVKLNIDFEKIYRLKFVKMVLTVFTIILVLLTFRDNFTSEYQMAEIHSKVIRTYAEEIIDLILLSFPPFVIIGGLLGIREIPEDKELDKLPGTFIILMLFGYSYLLLGASNSPQLYWILRRYYNVIIPLIFIIFMHLIKDLDRKMYGTFAVILLVISANMYFNSNQVSDYTGLDKSVANIDSTLDDKNVEVIICDKKDYPITSLVSYSDKQFIPIDRINLGNVIEWLKMKNTNNVIYLTQQNFGTNIKADLNVNINYKKQDENYGMLPKEHYDKKYDYFVYDISKMASYSDKGLIYCRGVSLFPIDSEVYDDGWTNGELTIKDLGILVNCEDKIVIQRIGYNNEIIDKQMVKGLKLLVNSEIILEDYSVENNNIIFNLDKLDGENINTISILSDTFVPNNGDTRELGLDIEKILMSQ